MYYLKTFYRFFILSLQSENKKPSIAYMGVLQYRTDHQIMLFVFYDKMAFKWDSELM